MNLAMIRSGNSAFVYAECIKGYSYKVAASRVESALFYDLSAATGSSFASCGTAA